MNVIAETRARVSEHTASSINARIRDRTEQELARAARDGRAGIERRLAELDREWDVERCLETGAASLSLIGAVLGVGANRRWFMLPAAVAAFLLQHALQGWCPPLPLFRRLGVRTADEINEERYALKALRGDFSEVVATGETGAVRTAIDATRH